MATNMDVVGTAQALQLKIEQAEQGATYGLFSELAEVILLDASRGLAPASNLLVHVETLYWFNQGVTVHDELIEHWLATEARLPGVGQVPFRSFTVTFSLEDKVAQPLRGRTMTIWPMTEQMYQQYQFVLATADEQGRPIRL